MSYKYTKDNDRKIFTTNGSKYAEIFIDLLKEIDWNWKYEGENIFLRGTYNEETEKNDFDFVKLQCTASLPPGANRLIAPSSPRSNSPSSSFTTMRNAWKINVAG